MCARASLVDRCAFEVVGHVGLFPRAELAGTTVLVGSFGEPPSHGLSSVDASAHIQLGGRICRRRWSGWGLVCQSCEMRLC